jgi:hypothetical protein
VLDGALKDLASTPGPLAASLFSPVVVQQKVDLLI